MNALASLITAFAGFAGDQITKKYADAELFNKKRELFGGRVTLMYCKNRGFAMNRLESDRKLVVAVSSVVFLILCAFYLKVLADDDCRPLRLGLSLVAAGAAGNVYDRIFRGGVTDFINVSFARKVVFNLADIFIVVGALLAIAGDIVTG